MQLQNMPYAPVNEKSEIQFENHVGHFRRTPRRIAKLIAARQAALVAPTGSANSQAPQSAANTGLAAKIMLAFCAPRWLTL